LRLDGLKVFERLFLIRLLPVLFPFLVLHCFPPLLNLASRLSLPSIKASFMSKKRHSQNILLLNSAATLINKQSGPQAV
jgi:hypothetical protein